MAFQPFPVGPVRPPFIVVPSEGENGGDDETDEPVEGTPAVDDDEVLDDDVELVDPQNPDPVDDEEEANTRVIEETTPATEDFEPEVKLSDPLIKQEILNQRVADFQALLG